MECWVGRACRNEKSADVNEPKNRPGCLSVRGPLTMQSYHRRIPKNHSKTSTLTGTPRSHKIKPFPIVPIHVSFQILVIAFLLTNRAISSINRRSATGQQMYEQKNDRDEK
jgi:hypothetical protein